MSSTSGVRNPSPWLSLWLKPSGTIDRIVASDPRHRVLLLASLSGIFAIALLLHAIETEYALRDWHIAVAVALAGIAIGIANLYISGFVIKWIGKFVGGKASALEIRAALAWGSVPLIVARGFGVIAGIGAVFARTHGVLAPDLVVIFWRFTLISAVILVSPLGPWSFVATIRMLARVQNFGVWRAVANLSVGVFLLLATAFFTKILLFEPYYVAMDSMAPALVFGDYLFVSKYPYGYSRYSLPWGLSLVSGRIFQGAPQYGDVVVFKLPTDNKTDYINRVVGLPGDRIQVIGTVLHINGQPVKMVQGTSYMRKDWREGVTQYLETLPNGVRHSIFKHSPNLVPGEGTSQPLAAATSPLICGSPSENAPLGKFDPNNTPIYQVAAGHYFVMGDNRDKSPDSRFLREVGCPPAENLIGRAEIIFYSGDRFLVGIPPVRRFERIGMAIE